MKLVAWMLAASVAAAGLLPVLFGLGFRSEVWLGMLGPLVSAAVSWIAMERQCRANRAGLAGLMIRAFAAKMIFIGAYVAIVLSVSWVRPVPFVVSFTGFFLVLHITEAIGLHRLQSAAFRPSGGSL
jgi:hypothetical protein